MHCPPTPIDAGNGNELREYLFSNIQVLCLRDTYGQSAFINTPFEQLAHSSAHRSDSNEVATDYSRGKPPLETSALAGSERELTQSEGLVGKRPMEFNCNGKPESSISYVQSL